MQNQFFISGLSGDDTIKNRVLEALYRRILRAEREKKRFKAIIVIPLLPGFQVIFDTVMKIALLLCYLNDPHGREALMMVELHL